MKKSRFRKASGWSIPSPDHPNKRRLQAGHADGWGLGGPHTDDGD